MRRFVRSSKKGLSLSALRLRRLSRAPQFEMLEPRLVLAASFVISEFMADNHNFLLDRYGNSSDWVEIHNQGDTAGSLNGYYLTDSASNKTKWQFPDVTVAANGYLMVFASNQDDHDPTQELHAPFALSKDGEYLGLIAPDGVTAVSEYAPAFPPQMENISYGIGNVFSTSTLVAPGANVSWLVPANGSLGQSWTQVGFNDSSWTSTEQIPKSRVVVTEANTNSTAVVEIQNVSGLSQVTAGWRVAVGDSGTDINSVNATRWLLPNNMLAGSVQYKTDGSTNAWGSNIAWSNTANGWVMIVDQYGNVVDFVAWGWTAAQIASLNVSFDGLANITVPGGMWSGDGLPLASNSTSNSYQRVGSTDNNNSGNWTRTSPTSNGVLNTGLSASFGSTAVPATTGVGYERDAGYQDLLGTTGVDTAMVGGNTSIYIRVPFTAAAGQSYASLKLRMKYDDGFVAYLNGTEVARRNAGGTAGTPLAYNAQGTDHPDAQATVFEDIDISAFKNLLVAGNNVLSIQGLNSSNTSTDLLILPELDATTVVSHTIGFMNPATPGAINGTASLGFLAEPVMSVTHGFFNASFPVTISDATPGVTIRYTTDDSTPTETNGTLYTGPITISGTADLRAAAFKTGYTTSDVETETYIFLSDIVTQSTSTPPGFAATGTNGQVLNYGMDPTIVNSSVWGPQMLAALQSIPSISIVTDQANLWNPTTGIYVNALNDGQDWERPASVELINPDGTTGFQINAGLRIRGGYSRNDYDPKHAFRLFFNDDYDGELVYPLFGDEGVDTFKKIDLRTDQNYSWSGEGDSRETFLRDTFSRDTMRDLGQPYTRGRSYFLYLNGQFWGIYQTEERPDADYAQSYFGGDDDNYDVVKANADNSAYNLTATDGNTDAFLQMWALANQVAAAPTQTQRYDIFMQMQGLNPDGTRNTSYPVLLDVDNLIDYMTVILYTGNLDAPISNFIQNVGINNWYGIRDRTGDQGFQFLVHDSEHTMLDVNQNRNGPFSAGNTADHANPQWIHQQLMACDEYRQMFADRIQQLMFNGGALTPANSLARLNERASEINLAIIAESARWGDSKHTPAYTKTDWQNAVNASITWINTRDPIVINQFRNTTLYNNGSLGASAPLFPSLNAQSPVFSQFGGNFAGGFQLSITDPSSGGVLYYTLDGSDPRVVGGSIAADANAYQSAIELPSGTVEVEARYRSASGEWSALVDATFTQTGIGLRPGDLNRDGKRSVADVSTMLTALSDLNTYRANYGVTVNDLQTIADLDGDHAVTNHDLQALISRLAQDAAQSAGARSGSGSASNSSITSDDDMDSTTHTSTGILPASNLTGVAITGVPASSAENIAQLPAAMVASTPASAVVVKTFPAITIEERPLTSSIQAAPVSATEILDTPGSDIRAAQQILSSQTVSLASSPTSDSNRETPDRRQLRSLRLSIPELQHLFDKRHMLQPIDDEFMLSDPSAVDELFSSWRY